MRRDLPQLHRRLAELQASARLRTRRVVEALAAPAQEARLQVGGQTLINFCGNDYLGLARHPALADALGTACTRYGLGSGASHLISGHSREHHALEEELAAFTGREAALLFSTGYMANLSILAVLCGRGEVVLQDRLNHASLIDGARLAGARLWRYAHADAGAAAERLADARVTLLASDGVFSMDGDVAPLGPLAAAASAHAAWFLVDEAHGLGVLGAHGRGAIEAAGLEASQVPVLMGTFGKALGTFGAFVAGDRALIDYLMQRARPYIYTTAVPAPIAAATRAALRLVQTEPWRRQRLHALIGYFRRQAAAAGVGLLPSGTAIQPLPIGDDARAVRLGERLAAAGFWVGAIRPPTVPVGSARLRITLSAVHTEADIDALLARLADLLRGPAA